MADPFATTPERSATLARIAYAFGIALAILAAALSKTLTYKTGIETFGDGSESITHEYVWIRGNGIDDWFWVASPVLISLAFAWASEIALRRVSRPAVRVALGFAVVAVLGTFYVMFGFGILYTVPWAMALSGSVVLTLQALEDSE